MTIAVFPYVNTESNLIRGSWDSLEYLVGAQLVTSSYTYDISHTTRADIEVHTVGQLISVSGKTIIVSDGVTTINCNPLDFTSNGTFNAAWVVLHEIESLSPSATDKLLMAIQLSEEATIDQSVSQAIRINPNGLIAFVVADYVAPPQTQIPGTDLVCSVGKTLDDPSAWVSGDVVCVDATTVDAFKLDGLNFSSPVKIWARSGATVNAGDGNNFTVSGVGSGGIVVTNCTNIELINFTVTGSTVTAGFIADSCNGITFTGCTSHDNKLFGIYTLNCSNVLSTNPVVYNVGQEGITYTLNVDQPFENWRTVNATVYNTGLATPVGESPFYGEGIYYGSGSFPNYGPVTNCSIAGGEIYNTRAEGIDIKSNIKDCTIDGVYLHDIVIPYNGAVTVGTENETGFDSTYTVINCITENVTVTNSFNWSHIAIGRGNITVEGCEMRMTNSPQEHGISLYTTSKNRAFSDAFIGRNTFGDGLTENWVSINEFDGSTGATNTMNYFVKPTPDNLPVLWMDANDAETITDDGLSGVVSVEDKSLLGFTMEQTDINNRPSTGTRQINGINAFDFETTNGDFFQITNGPQLLSNCMYFAVIDLDSTSSCAIVSFQIGGGLEVGIGIDAGNFFIEHGDDNSHRATTPAATGQSLVSAYRNGTTLFIDVNGTTGTSELAVDQRTLDRWCIGATRFNSGSNGSRFNGAMGEVRVYDFFDQDLFTQIKSDLTNKWGL